MRKGTIVAVFLRAPNVRDGYGNLIKRIPLSSNDSAHAPVLGGGMEDATKSRVWVSSATLLCMRKHWPHGNEPCPQVRVGNKDTAPCLAHMRARHHMCPLEMRAHEVNELGGQLGEKVHTSKGSQRVRTLSSHLWPHAIIR